MEKVYGVKPDLHPTCDDFDQYTRYISGTSVKTHLQHGPGKPAPESPQGAVVSAFKSIRKYNREMRQPSLTPDRIALRFGLNILEAESNILQTGSTTWQNSRGQDKGRAERFKACVERGQSSLMYIHGRDGQTTGFDEFDALYKAAWDRLNVKEAYAEELKSHSLAVYDAEVAILGKAALADLMA